MSTHNICFHEEKKNQYFWTEKSILSRAMAFHVNYLLGFKSYQYQDSLKYPTGIGKYFKGSN